MSVNYRTFGSYILFKEVCADDLGHVWRAAELDRKGIARTVWLRIFDAPQVPSADLLARLEIATRVGQELEAATLPSRPRAVAEGGTVALAWDWVSAQPLSRTLEKVSEEGFPVPVDNALLILEKISLALTAALAFEVRGEALVHGLVHPGLVLVGTDGEAQLAGFGLADQLLGVLDDSGAASRVAPYLAPEVLANRTPSKRADVYSLGAILFHLLTGKALPGDPAARAEALSGAELAFDDQPVPADIRGLLDRSLAPRPEDRHSSAADFKKELDKLLYGGAYSPTTFNLALFMDRLFRSELEVEERERAAEAQVDPAPYLRPEPKAEPEEVSGSAPTRPGPGRALWIGLAAAAVVIVGLVALLVRGPSGPPPTPTPGPEEIRARREAQQRQMQELVQQQLEQMLAEREAQIREELLARQGKIEELQRRLQEAEKRGRSGGAEAQEAERTRAEIQRQLEAEQEAKRLQEAALEAERQKALEAAQKQVAEATPDEPDEVVPATAEGVAGDATGAGPGATTEAATVPTAAPTRPRPTPTVAVAAREPADATAPSAASSQLVENQFVPAPECDSLPSVIKDQAVVWPRLAVMSRRRGVVILQATVNASGKVEDVKVLRADHEGFGIPQAAMEAVRGYLFKPATKDGVRVKSTATVTVPYAFARS